MTSKGRLELRNKITKEQEDNWYPTFEQQARYLGNGIYAMGRNHSTDTRELFLMFVADMEDIDYEGKEWEAEDEVE